MTDQNYDDDSTSLPTMQDLRRSTRSRRAVLAGSGVVLGAGVLGTGTVLGQDEEDDESPPSDIPPEFDRPNTDADILNYALTLERLEDTFYQRGLEEFSDDEIASATVLEGTEIRQQVPGYLQTIGEHETQHTEQLLRVLDVLGAEPAAEPEFQFTFESADEFLATAQVLENTGVSAYAGAAPRIESPDILSAALSIHSVEARHAGTLNFLNGESPFPDAFDPALAIPEVLQAIQPFIVSEETETPSEEPTDTPTEEPTEEPTETPTETPTAEPEETLTDVPDNATDVPPDNATDGQ